MINDILNGTLLGDGCVFLDRGKYPRYKLTAKDKRFVFWLKNILEEDGFKTYTSFDKRNNNNILYSSKNPVWADLRKKWYSVQNGFTRKIIPDELKLSPKSVLFWYLGDGCLVRRKNNLNRVPTIVLATNCFSKEDIDILIGKLKELSLNFYPVEYTSGFNKGKKCGYCLYSKTEDGTPFRFFRYIGLECPKEIANFSTGSKGIYHEEKFFKNKWPTEEDWIKILSNVKVGSILRKKRLELSLSQNQFGRKVGLRRENIRDVELGKRNFRVRNFKKVLNGLGLRSDDLVKYLP